MIVNASIIISSFNQSDSIAKAIPILIQQSNENSYVSEVIIADDGSNDNEIFNLRNIIAVGNSSHVQIKLAWQQDLGFRLAASRNNGIELATGNTLIFLDGDCIPQDGFLKDHVSFHQSHINSIYIGKREYKPSPKASNNKSDIVKCELAENMEDYTISLRSKSPLPWTAVFGRNFSIKRPEPMVYFNEQMYGWGGEDLDYALSLKKAGIDRVIYNADAKVCQYGIPQSGDPHYHQDSLKTAYTQINHLILMEKNKSDNETYIELAKYLKYYQHPFSFDGKSLTYDKTKSEEAIRAFTSSFSRQQADALFADTKNEIVSLATVDNRVKIHPAYHLIDQ